MGARLSLISGDRDLGDYDPSEFSPQVVDVWHPSHLPAVLPESCSSEKGREVLADLLANLRKPKAVESRQPVQVASWKETPELMRKMCAAQAGLSADVVKKLDRDLSESEKAMLRQAAKDICFSLGQLVNL